MSKLSIIKLGDCLDRVIDYRGKTPIKLGGNWSETGYRVISALNVHRGFIDNIKQIRFVDDTLYKKWMQEEVKINDILLTSEGASLGENTIWDTEEKIVLGQRLFAIRTDPKKLDPWFLAAYMQSEKFRKQIDQISTGSTVFGISQPLLLGVKIVIPDINIQKKIGEMYKTLRKKIIVNREIKREIENFSRTLYNFWFNQFEFPTGSKRNYKSYGEEMVYNVTFKKEIPKGWVVKKFGDLIVENKKSTIQVGDAIKIIGSIPFFTSGDDILQVEQFMVDGTNIFLNTGGNANVNFYNGKASYSTDTWCIRGKDNLTNYLALYLISIKDFLYTKFFHGTGLKHLQKELLKNELILVPSNEALESLNRVFDKFSLIMSHVLDENHRLEEFKKYIFPLLTTGQVIFEKDKL